MNTKRIVYLVVGTGFVLLLWFLLSPGSGSEGIVKTRVQRGTFHVTVTTTGELQAKNSEDINAPRGLRKAGIWRVTIEDLVDEGTVVKEGDYIATLDRTDATTKLKDLEAELVKAESQYLQTQLDTTLTLRGARDELINLKYGLEEKKLTLQQSKFEPPAVIRQAEIDLDKAERSFDQAEENYDIKRSQAVAKMSETAAILAKHQRRHKQLVDLLDMFIINAPKAGMVIYVKEWDGSKKTVGSEISPWNKAVATLPDMSEMSSKTFVNEIDIGKLKEGQKVVVGVDALADKEYKGTVVEVANIGEQKPNSTAKVFEVNIDIEGTDTLLRPSMTTSNDIRIASFEDTIFIPLESVFSNDSISFVYLKKSFGTVKKHIELGMMNENEALVAKGLDESDVIMLSVPEDADELDFQGID